VVGGFWRKRQWLLWSLGNFWGFLWNFEGFSGLGPIRNYLLKLSGACCNFSNCTGAAVQFTTSLGVFAQRLRDLSNLELFFNGKTRAPGAWCRGPMVWPVMRWTEDGTSPVHGVSGATGLQSSLVKAREEEGDEAVSVRGSLELE
jgi:hypothetical protein